MNARIMRIDGETSSVQPLSMVQAAISWLALGIFAVWMAQTIG